MPASLSPDRTLGKTGVRVPLVGYGTAPLGKEHVSRAHAVRCLNEAIDLGVTYLDTSPDYGSEPHVGEVMRTRRKEVFLATKVNKRSAQGALDELRQSLERLQTDHVDLVQIHAVNAWADAEQVLAPDGAAAGMKMARAEGLCRFIGITGHARPDILRYTIEQHPFDTLLVAVGMADHLITAPSLFVLPAARERDMGIIAMKVLGHGEFSNPERGLRYALGLEGVSMAIVGMDTPEQVRGIVEMAARFRPLDEGEEGLFQEEVKGLLEKDREESKEGHSRFFWLHDNAVMGWQTGDEPRMVVY